MCYFKKKKKEKIRFIVLFQNNIFYLKKNIILIFGNYSFNFKFNLKKFKTIINNHSFKLKKFKIAVIIYNFGKDTLI